MKKLLPLIVFLLHYNLSTFAQNVGIGTNNPDASAKLHIEDGNKGLLIPRVSLIDVTNGTTPVNTPVISLLIYNTNAAVTGGSGEGFYYWNGSIWSKISGEDHDWYEVGTTNSPNDINDNIFTQGNVGIGTTTPSDKLHVAGRFRVTDVSFHGNTASFGPGGSGSGVISWQSNNFLMRARGGRELILDANNNNTGHFRILTTGDLRYQNYPNTRNDAATTAIENLLYTNINGTLLSTSLAAIIDSTKDHDWYEVGTTDSPNDINDNIYTQGIVGIGTLNPVHALDINQSGTAQLRLSGGQNGFTNAELILQANQGANSRGLGTFMFDALGQNEWFTGRPYSGGLGNSDLFIISRNTGMLSHNSATSGIQDGANVPTSTEVFFAIRNSGYTGLGIYNPDARLHVASGGNGINNYTAKFVSSPSSGGSGGIVFTNTEAVNATGFKWHTLGTGVGTFADDDLVLSSVAVNSGATNRANLFTIQGNGNIGLGVLNSANPIQHSSGARLTTAGVWTNASDRRLKTNISSSKYGLKEVLQLRSVDYTMKKDGSQQVGFIAQEVQTLIPEVVNGTEGDIKNGETLGIAYGQLVPVLTKAIQEQQTTIDAQAKTIANLENNNVHKETSIQELRANLSNLNERMEQLESLLKKTAQK